MTENTPQATADAKTEGKSDLMAHVISPRWLHAIQVQTPMGEFYAKATYMSRVKEPGSLDFTAGEGHELPPPAFVEALQRWLVPQKDNWFGYKSNLPEARAAVSAALQAQRGLAISPEDIFMTNGTLTGLAMCLQLLAGAGDEVILISPPWFGYRRMIHIIGAVPVPVPVEPTTFDLDLDAIAAAITERTRAILINSPHNPTGKIYSETALEGLAAVLASASQRYSRPIYLISDECFSCVVFDNRRCPSPTQFYPFSFLVYGYSKILMAPGMRAGYIALPPAMPEKEPIRRAISLAQSLGFGFCYPSALMQYALTDVAQLTLDIRHLQRKRDWMVKALQEMGYKLRIPEGTFFLLLQSPWRDDCAFAELLASYDLFVFPGTPLEIPGYLRVSLTASEDMISRALPKFQAALEYATANPPA